MIPEETKHSFSSLPDTGFISFVSGGRSSCSLLGKKIALLFFPRAGVSSFLRDKLLASRGAPFLIA